MARRKINHKKPYVAASKPVATSDALASFTQSMAASALSGSGGYRDGPYSGYAKDATTFNNSYYSTSWIARAAVEMIPEDCFKKGYQWVADSEQINRIEAVEKRFQVQQKKRKALSRSRRDGEAFIYFDIGDDPTQPLDIERVRRDGLRFVNVLRMRNVTKGNAITDPMSEFYEKPEYYEISGGSGSVRIHPSRIIHFISSPNAETGAGQSVLLHLLPPIIAAETARDNTVALTTEALIDVLKAEGLMDAMQDPQAEAAIVQRYTLARTLKATNKMMVIDKEKEDFDRKPSSFTNLPEVIETMRREAAAAIGIPYSLLYGRPGGLGTNGDVELKNYYDNIATMQRNDIQPICEPLDEVVIRSALGSRPDEIHLDWSSLWEMSDAEKANVAKTYAEAAKTAIDAGIMLPDMLTNALMNSWVEIGAFPGIEQDVADRIDELASVEANEADLAGRGEGDTVTP